MQERSYIPFTEQMKEDYTILIPTMLPMHFRLITSVLGTYGYKMEVLDNCGPDVAEAGLGYVHNDACYPAVLVIGQFLQALRQPGRDPHRLALMLFQTGGGCRASNYVSLLRKALARAGFDYVPVIGFSLGALEKHPGFRLSPRQLLSLLHAVVYGDLLMTLVNQVKPYEKEQGAAEALAEQWTERLGRELGAGGRIRWARTKANCRAVIAAFARLPREPRPTVKVGVVGEIFVKYSPLGNNDLEQFLVDEGAEVVIPGLLDFCLYSLSDRLVDYRLYGKGPLSHLGYAAAYRELCRRKRDVIRLLEEEGSFTPPTSFEEVFSLSEGYIGHGAKMGEGWLLTAEMLELIRSGVTNIVCTQPFGCLPNHICGKGMMRPIKERNPGVNIVAIDYDPGATRVNQENRLKLMLAQARENAGKRDGSASS
ncbi:MAG: 2-hydroxyacyl-CoA dehydratase [Firmicutes bacterium]|nr:2-hydroxyacyl-CoA dehydratase [Bacillota bacterium]